MRIIRSPRALLFAIIGIPCFVACLLTGYTVQRSTSEAASYNDRLRDSGIDPSIENAENYIWQSIQPGKLRSEILEKLSILGTVGFIKILKCDGLSVDLSGVPGSRFALLVPPDRPPQYRAEICFSVDDRVSSIDAFIRVDQYAPGLQETLTVRTAYP